MSALEIVGTIVFAIFMALANISGIGGGGVAIPMLMGFFGFENKKAIAISSFTILISTIARFFYTFNNKHPEKPNSTLLDYNLAAVMMPLTLLGSQIGAYIYLSFPDIVLEIILTLLMIFLTIQSGRKGL